jgi:hypothetical protein
MPSDLLASLRDPGALFDCPVCGVAAGAPCEHKLNRERLALRAQIEGTPALHGEAQ